MHGVQNGSTADEMMRSLCTDELWSSRQNLLETSSWRLMLQTVTKTAPRSTSSISYVFPLVSVSVNVSITVHSSIHPLSQLVTVHLRCVGFHGFCRSFSFCRSVEGICNTNEAVDFARACDIIYHRSKDCIFS